MAAMLGCSALALVEPAPASVDGGDTAAIASLSAASSRWAAAGEECGSGSSSSPAANKVRTRWPRVEAWMVRAALASTSMRARKDRPRAWAWMCTAERVAAAR